MSYPFSVGSAAFVELGDGGAHDPQIKFTADDGSCKWNAFPVCIDAEIFQPTPPAGVFSSTQLLPFTTTPGGGGSSPTEAQWPSVYVYDFAHGVLSGYKLQARVRFTASGGTSVGSLGVGVATSCGSKPGPIFGVYDSGFFDLTTAPCTCSGTAGVLVLHLIFTNFDPTGNTVTITNGILDLQWVASGAHSPEYEPNQRFTIQWRPPCEVDAGLYIALGTDSCGLLTKTYTQVASAVNALSLGITASILGGHGGDIAKPDPSCPAPDYCCDMAGATCSGSIDN